MLNYPYSHARLKVWAFLLCRVTKNFDFGSARYGCFRFPINFCRDRFIKVILSAISAYGGWHIAHDDNGVFPLQGHRNQSWLCFAVFADDTLHDCLRVQCAPHPTLPGGEREVVCGVPAQGLMS